MCIRDRCPHRSLGPPGLPSARPAAGLFPPRNQVQNCLTNLEVTERNGVPTAKGVLDRVLGQSLQAGSFVARTLHHNPLPTGVRTAAGTAAPSFTGPADRTRVRL